MKFRINLYVLLLLTLSLACSPRKEGESEDAEGRTWAAMDDYHMIMAESYHPLKDSANLAPARANAEALAAEAEKWATSELPKKADNDEMKARLKAIQSGSRAFADMVKANASDEELSAALTALHDEFHKTMEAWAGGHSEHH
jgi:hypothetical protein